MTKAQQAKIELLRKVEKSLYDERRRNLGSYGTTKTGIRIAELILRRHIARLKK